MPVNTAHFSELSKTATFSAAGFAWAFQTYRERAHWPQSHLPKFLLRTAYYALPSKRWFAFLSNSSLREFAENNPRLLERVHRPFFDHRLSPLQRTAMLINHYKYFNEHFIPSFVQSILHGKTLTLATLHGKTDRIYNVALARADHDKEGCLSLHLIENETIIFTMTFTLQNHPHRKTLLIGGIQGGRQGHEAIKIATREMHGIQPRLLLLAALRELAANLKFDAITAIDQKHHVFKSLRYRFKKRIVIGGGYNELWLAVDGTLSKNGHFSIPLLENQILIEERPSHKRSEYKKRALLTSALRDQFRSHLSSIISQ